MKTAGRPDAVLEQIEEAYRNRYPVFLRVAMAIVGDVELARDAVHDAFVRPVRHRRRFRGGREIEPWLWRIVVNAARKRARVREIPAELGEQPAPVSLSRPRLGSIGLLDDRHVAGTAAERPFQPPRPPFE